MELRPFEPRDGEETAKLFYESVHRINKRDYPPNQLDALAPSIPLVQEWIKTFEGKQTWVALKEGKIIGFADLSADGFLGRIYVHPDHQRQGVGSALCNRLECGQIGGISTHASITAKPFFEGRGYRFIKERATRYGSLWLTDFLMEK